MKRKFKRYLSMTLVLAMLMSLYVGSFGVVVYADDSEFDPYWYYGYCNGTDVSGSIWTVSDYSIEAVPNNGILVDFGSSLPEDTNVSVVLKYKSVPDENGAVSPIKLLARQGKMAKERPWHNNNRFMSTSPSLSVEPIISSVDTGTNEGELILDGMGKENTAMVVYVVPYDLSASESDIGTLVHNGSEDNPTLNSYLSTKYKFEYEISIQSKDGTKITGYNRNLTDNIANLDNKMTGVHDSTVEDKRFEYYQASTSFFKLMYDTGNGLPNGGIILDFSSNLDLNKYGDTAYAMIKFNPNGDKSLNTQDENYNDSAVTLIASTAMKLGDHYAATNSTYAYEAYPDSNCYGQTLKVPVTAGAPVVICRVERGGFDAYTEYNAKKVSSRYNFSYEISLEDASGRAITSYVKDGGAEKQASNYIAGGILSNVFNPLDSYDIKLSEATGQPPQLTGTTTDGGINLEFTEVPEGFDYSYLSMKFKMLSNKSEGSSAFGYSKKTLGGNNESGYLGGSTSVLDYSIYNICTSYGDEYANEGIGQQRIGYGEDRESEVDFRFKVRDNYYGEPNSDKFVIVPNSTYYNLSYSLKLLNPRYKFELVDSLGDVFLDEYGVVHTFGTLSSFDKKLHNVKLKIVELENSEKIDPSSSSCEDGSGLPNWGILTGSTLKSSTRIQITNRATELNPTGYTTFVLDYYYPNVNEGFKWLIWSEYGHYTGDEPRNIGQKDDTGKYYGVSDKYFLGYRALIQSIKVDETVNIDIRPDLVYPKVEEVTETEYNELNSDETIKFMHGGKYYHALVTKSTFKEFYETSTTYGHDIPFYQDWSNGSSTYWRIDDPVYPLTSVRPLANHKGGYAPEQYNYDYRLQSGYYNTAFDSVEQWSDSQFVESGYTLYPESNPVSLKVFSSILSESANHNNLSDEGVRFNLLKVNYASEAINKTTLPLLLGKRMLGLDTEYHCWVDSATEEYIGEFNLSDVPYGLLVTAEDIKNKGYELPYLNIDLTLKEGIPDTRFCFVFGEVRDGVFHAKKPYTGDWSTNVKQVDQYGNSYIQFNGTLSSAYTYTIHSHLDVNDAILIFTDDYNTGAPDFDYKISTRNIGRYNIDDVIDEPVGNIERTVGNNITYSGSTDSLRGSGNYQKIGVKFKGVESNNKPIESYNRDSVKYVYARLFDYDFGKEKDFNLQNQSSEFKFLFNPQDEADLPVNTWHTAPFTGIVDTSLEYPESDNGSSKQSIGVPKFNYSTPFSNLFTVSNETDANGNTKKSYETLFEFNYDENYHMYSYNSTLHAAVYNSERNVILTYLTSLGIDGWGMQGAGFFPFNSFKDDGEWGTAEKYNQNTWLVKQSDINYHLGMALDMEFKVPKDRVVINEDGTTSDFVFKFSGDDDVWVFVDDQLVLDLGGIHEAQNGTINFTDGTYTVNNTKYKLSDCLNFDTESSEWDANTSHSVKMYYLERGGTLSNASIQFNIPVEQESPTYKVTYDGNGNDTGTPPVDNTPYFGGETVTIKDSNGITKEGYSFIGWAMSPNSDESDVIESFNIVSDTTLYAVWKPVVRTLSYDLNGGTSDDLSLFNPVKALHGSKVTVISEKPTKDGYKFLYWSEVDSDTKYYGEESINLTSDVTLKASWSPMYKVTYDLNTGGRTASENTPVDTKEYMSGDSAILIDGSDIKLFISGNTGAFATFKGWNTKSDGTGTSYTFNGSESPELIIEGNITLYAQWDYDPTPTSLPDTGSYMMWWILGVALLLIGVGVSLRVKSTKQRNK